MTLPSYHYGQTSCERRDTCHPDAVAILNEVIKYFDATILCGVRTEEDQLDAFRNGKSKVLWPDSAHNVDPKHPKDPDYPDKSMAFDLAEYRRDLPGHIDWVNRQGFWDKAKLVLLIAERLKDKGVISHDLVWGGDWDGDGVPVFLDADETFWDAAHFELRKGT